MRRVRAKLFGISLACALAIVGKALPASAEDTSANVECLSDVGMGSGLLQECVQTLILTNQTNQTLSCRGTVRYAYQANLQNVPAVAHTDRFGNTTYAPPEVNPLTQLQSRTVDIRLMPHQSATLMTFGRWNRTSVAPFMSYDTSQVNCGP